MRKRPVGREQAQVGKRRPAVLAVWGEGTNGPRSARRLAVAVLRSVLGCGLSKIESVVPAEQ